MLSLVSPWLIQFDFEIKDTDNHWIYFVLNEENSNYFYVEKGKITLLWKSLFKLSKYLDCL